MTKNLPGHRGAVSGSDVGMTGIGVTGIGSAATGPAGIGSPEPASPEPASPDILAEYRLAPAYRRPFLSRFIISAVPTGLLAFAVAERPDPGLLLVAGLLGLAALYNGIAYVWRGRFRTRVTTHGIEVRGYFSHFVPWAEVKAIQEEGYGQSQPLDAGYDVQYAVYGAAPRPGTFRKGGGRMGSTTGRRARLGVIRIVRRPGKGLMLRAPLVTAWAPDPYFSAKLRQMQALSGQYGTRPVDG
jgi:hypothetical protein